MFGLWKGSEKLFSTTKHCMGRPQGTTWEAQKGLGLALESGLVLGLVIELGFAYYPSEPCLYCVPLWSFEWSLAVLSPCCITMTPDFIRSD